MRIADSIAWLATMLAITAIAFAAPWPVVALLTAGALLALRRSGFLVVAGTTMALDALILALTGPGWIAGVLGGARLVAALGWNIHIVARVGPARLLDGLRLPPRVTAPIAAVLLAARDVGEDLARLREARAHLGEWPSSRLARVAATAGLLPQLLLLAERRARARQDALRLAGLSTGARFVPVLTVAALAAAGRLAFQGMPNVSLAFVVVFLGGAVYGWRAGALGGALAMLVSDFFLSGLYPLSLVNAPAMALVALAGAAVGRMDLEGGSRSERAAGRIFAFVCGALATVAFSVASDTLTWLVVAPGVWAAWRGIVLLGLAFNVVPAALNGLLFALSVSPVLGAYRAWQEGGRPPERRLASLSPTPPEPAAPSG